MVTSTQVNVPMDPKQRDKDIENKLRFYGITQGFASGKLPTNQQIDVALNSFLNNRQLKSPNGKLSTEGKSLVEDFRNVVEQAKLLLLTKNHDQALQEFIWHTEQLGARGQAPGTAGNANLPVSKDTVNRDGQQALEGLRTLGTLIISNGQFRKLLQDAQILFRDIAGDAATKAARKVNPTEDELNQIDRPAPDNQWHDVPDKERLKQQARETVDRNKPISRDEVRQAAGNATQAADPNGSRDPRDVAHRAAEDQRYGTGHGVDARGGVQAGVDTLRDRMRENIPDEHQDRAKRQWGSTKDYFGDKMNDDRRRQTIYRLKKMVVEIQGHPDYQQAIDTLLGLAENYRGHAKTAVGEGRSQVEGAHNDNHLQSAEGALKTLLERFANYTSMDDLIDSINDIYRDADRDPELKSWFRQMDSYIRRCLKTQGYILQDDANREWDQLNDEGRFLLRDRYRDHTDRVVNEFRFFGEQFAQDSDSQRLGNALTKLFTDLGNDENGKPTFKKHLVKDVTQVIIPDIFEQVRYVPVPRIEYSDSMIDAVVENLVIESDNLMPNVFEISNDSYFRWGRRTASSANKQSFMVSVGGIQCDLRDVSYYVKKKQGFPSITDTGIADFFLGGNGLSFKIHLSSAGKTSRQSFFKCDKVEVNIASLTIKLKKSNHKTLFAIVKPLLLKIMRPALTKVLEKQIKDSFNKFDGIAYRVYQEQEKAKKEVLNNPENAPNVYRRYAQALQNEFMKKKQKAEAVASDKEMKVAVTQNDSLDRFKHISLPGGISTKATEYQELARKGDRWQSDVFSIGSASPSSNISKPHSISRKSPHAHRAGINHRSEVPVAASSTNAGYNSTTTRTSRDSGYHGNEPVLLNAGYSASQFASKLEEQNKVGGYGNQVAGNYGIANSSDNNYGRY